MLTKTQTPDSVSRVNRFYVSRKFIIAWCVNFCNYFLDCGTKETPPQGVYLRRGRAAEGGMCSSMLEFVNCSGKAMFVGRITGSHLVQNEGSSNCFEVEVPCFEAGAATL